MQPWDYVTASDIAERAGLATAVFYRHFATREQLLDELIRTMAADWLGTATRGLGAARTPDELCALTSALLGYLGSVEDQAKIYFLSSATAPAEIEAVRAASHNGILVAAVDAVRRIAPGRAPALIEINAVALVALLELAARSQLGVDEPFRILGLARFHEEMGRLTRIATGFPDGGR